MRTAGWTASPSVPAPAAPPAGDPRGPLGPGPRAPPDEPVPAGQVRVGRAGARRAAVHAVARPMRWTPRPTRPPTSPPSTGCGGWSRRSCSRAARPAPRHRRPPRHVLTPLVEGTRRPARHPREERGRRPRAGHLQPHAVKRLIEPEELAGGIAPRRRKGAPRPPGYRSRWTRMERLVDHPPPVELVEHAAAPRPRSRAARAGARREVMPSRGPDLARAGRGSSDGALPRALGLPPRCPPPLARPAGATEPPPAGRARAATGRAPGPRRRSWPARGRPRRRHAAGRRAPAVRILRAGDQLAAEALRVRRRHARNARMVAPPTWPARRTSEIALQGDGGSRRDFTTRREAAATPTH